MQPTYLPWAGYFDLIDSVDKFVFLDNVKLEKSSWHVRNRIKSATGDLMLSISVKLPFDRLNTMINQAQLNQQNPWQTKHIKSMDTNYGKAKFYPEIKQFIDPLILAPSENLSIFNINLIKNISKKLGINTEIFVASELTSIEGEKDERLVSICRNLGCDTYLSPAGAADYIENGRPGGALSRENISLYYQQFEHPIYPQLFGDFISKLSIVDMLFNNGFNSSVLLVRSGHRPPIDFKRYRQKLGK
jgi:hypothetical protein